MMKVWFAPIAGSRNDWAVPALTALLHDACHHVTTQDHSKAVVYAPAGCEDAVAAAMGAVLVRRDGSNILSLSAASRIGVKYVGASGREAGASLTLIALLAANRINSTSTAGADEHSSDEHSARHWIGVCGLDAMCSTAPADAGGAVHGSVWWQALNQLAALALAPHCSCTLALLHMDKEAGMLQLAPLHRSGLELQVL